ncbi:hypothetical protein Tco_1530120 [Tanacetum coccineum]
MDKCKTGLVEKSTVETNEPKTDSKEEGAPIIEDWVSESKEEDVHKVCVVEENKRIHEDKKLKRRSKLKIKIPRHLSTVLAITGAYELRLS